MGEKEGSRLRDTPCVTYPANRDPVTAVDCDVPAKPIE